MPARERKKLTDAGIARLRPQAREYTVWDRNLTKARSIPRRSTSISSPSRARREIAASIPPIV